ncbi:hypothetical protein BLNAU_16143 [Blattamonas nauphoetae]|uniref:Uncharacterized protein n=1 Tax=Blattamonas nauphoetae TaxID=2049346 RepID=A0ABQ9XFE8_9EUKA|nr:hypothetical protein BLNAU_16143 [Blattamonas nauphoetae]
MHQRTDQSDEVDLHEEHTLPHESLKDSETLPPELEHLEELLEEHENLRRKNDECMDYIGDLQRALDSAAEQLELGQKSGHLLLQFEQTKEELERISKQNQFLTETLEDLDGQRQLLVETLDTTEMNLKMTRVAVNERDKTIKQFENQINQFKEEKKMLTKTSHMNTPTHKSSLGDMDSSATQISSAFLETTLRKNDDLTQQLTLQMKANESIRRDNQNLLSENENLHTRVQELMSQVQEQSSLFETFHRFENSAAGSTTLQTGQNEQKMRENSDENDDIRIEVVHEQEDEQRTTELRARLEEEIEKREEAERKAAASIKRSNEQSRLVAFLRHELEKERMIKSDPDSLSQYLNDLENDRTALTEQVEQLSHALGMERQVNNTHGEENTHLTQHTTELTRSLEEQTKAIDTLSKDASTTKAELQAVQVENLSLREKLSDTQDQLTRTLELLTNARQTAEKTVEEKNILINSLNTHIDELIEENHGLKGETEGYHMKDEEERATFDSLQTQIAELKNQVADLNNQLAQVKEERDRSAEQYAKREEEVASALSEYDDLKTRIECFDDLERVISESKLKAEKDAQEKELRLNTVMDEMVSLHKELNEAHAEIEQLNQTLLAKEKAHTTETRLLLKELKDVTDKHERAVEQYRADLDGTRLSVHEKEKELIMKENDIQRQLEETQRRMKDEMAERDRDLAIAMMDLEQTRREREELADELREIEEGEREAYDMLDFDTIDQQSNLSPSRQDQTFVSAHNLNRTLPLSDRSASSHPVLTPARTLNSVASTRSDSMTPRRERAKQAVLEKKRLEEELNEALKAKEQLEKTVKETIEETEKVRTAQKVEQATESILKKGMKEEMSTLRKELDNLRQKLTDQNSLINTLKDEKNNSEVKLEDLHQSLTKIQDEKQQFSDHCDQLLKAQLELTKKRSDINRELSDMRAEKRQLEVDNSHLSRQVRTLEEELDQTHTELISVATRHSPKKASLLSEEEQLLIQQQQEIRDATREADEAKREARSHRLAMIGEQSRHEIALLRSQRKEAEIERHKRQTQESEEEVKKREQTIQRLQQEKTLLEDTMGDLSDELGRDSRKHNVDMKQLQFTQTAPLSYDRTELSPPRSHRLTTHHTSPTTDFHQPVYHGSPYYSPQPSSGGLRVPSESAPPPSSPGVSSPIQRSNSSPKKKVAFVEEVQEQTRRKPASGYMGAGSLQAQNSREKGSVHKTPIQERLASVLRTTPKPGDLNLTFRNSLDTPNPHTRSSNATQSLAIAQNG